ncbi:hypothetical protein RFI_30993, partial [Reticulomyxa filosa]
YTSSSSSNPKKNLGDRENVEKKNWKNLWGKIEGKNEGEKMDRKRGKILFEKREFYLRKWGKNCLRKMEKKMKNKTEKKKGKMLEKKKSKKMKRKNVLPKKVHRETLAVAFTLAN